MVIRSLRIEKDYSKYRVSSSPHRNPDSRIRMLASIHLRRYDGTASGEARVPGRVEMMPECLDGLLQSKYRSMGDSRIAQRLEHNGIAK